MSYPQGPCLEDFNPFRTRSATPPHLPNLGDWRMNIRRLRQKLIEAETTRSAIKRYRF